MEKRENNPNSHKNNMLTSMNKILNKIFNIRKSETKYIKIYLCVFIVFMLFLVVAGNFKIGYAVEVNNIKVGYVKEKNETNILIEDLKKELIEYSSEGDHIDITASYAPTIALNNSFADDPEKIIDNVKNTVDLYTNAYSVYVDDTFAFAMEDEASVNKALKRFSDMYTPDGEILSLEVLNNVEIKSEKVLYARISDENEAIKTMKGYKKTDELYTVKEGDTLWGIGMHNDVTPEDLMEINELDSDTIVPGQRLRISNIDPLVNVKVVRNITYTEYEPFETEYIYDSNLTKGTNKVVQEGSKGEKIIKATVTTVNKHETERIITEENVISTAVKNIIKVGTKPKPKTAATGRFMRPVSGGYTSSAFGNRSRGYHTGIDWAIAYGTPIYAADGGTVTSSGWGGGYGYMIKINHGNGYETLYAHCSKLVVKAGTKVAKGQLIAYVGSTGNSTGPHLHFEIRKNGSYLNPANFV